jgi:NAD(P)-dependent dehydrogenase (short-subunit alcohol dehydrogenase family)
MELRFDGRVAIVTGAGRERGLGESHARMLAQRGAKVVVNDLAVEGKTPAQRVSDEINAAGGTAVANGDDVSSASGGEAIVATALDHFGRVDIVINNAGTSTQASFPEANDLDEFTRSFEVHLGGAFNVTRAAWRHFVANDYGRILNTTSSALLGLPSQISYADREKLGNAGVSYATMKSAMIGLTKCLASYAESRNIRANAIAPAAATQLAPHNVTRLETGEEISLDPGLVSAGVVLLVHELCPVTGEVFGIGGGRVDRLFVGATEGYLEVELTPERLLENWERVMDTDQFWIPVSSKEHSDRLRQDRAVSIGARLPPGGVDRPIPQ